MEDLSTVFDIEKWEYASLEKISKSLDRKKNANAKTFQWKNFKNELSPLSVYKLLRAKFGIPNGFIMLFKDETTDNLIHWHYTFLIENNEIHFLGKTSGLEIILNLDSVAKIVDVDWDILIKNLKNNFAKNGKAMSEIQKDFQKYTLFINPFARLNHTLEDLIYELQNLNLVEVEKRNLNELSEIEREIYHEDFNSWIINIERATVLGTTVRMLSPVLAESFINLIILILCKEDYKKDKRLYESVIRQQIDIRVKTLHINCNGFIKHVDGESKEFKDFHKLMNGRNDFLHGNIDPINLMFEDVYFDLNNIPLFDKDDGIIRKTMKNYLKNVEPEIVFEDFKIVNNFIHYVIEHLDEEYKNFINHLLITRMPGYNHRTKGIGILFPNHLAENVD